MNASRAPLVRRGTTLLCLVALLTLAGIAPAGVLAAPSFSITVDTGASAHVGETITLTPVVAGIETVDRYRCVMSIQYDQGVSLVWMEVASDTCDPWTVTIPPSRLGEFTVNGSLITDTSGVIDATTFGPEPLQIVDGTPVAFASNYPVRSWAPSDLLSDPSPSFGEPFTIGAPPSVDGCMLAVFAGMEREATYQHDGCDPWTLTIPAPTPDVARDMFGDRADVAVRGWEGTSAWGEQNPESPMYGSRYGATYNSTIPTFTGAAGGSYASSLPAVFGSDGRGNVYYVDDPTVHHVEPVVIGTTQGTCTSLREPHTSPVTADGCGAFVLAPPGTSGNWQDSVVIELRDATGRMIAETSFDVGYVEPLADIDVDVPDNSPPDVGVDVGVSTADGVPETYQVTFTQVAPASGLTSSAARSTAGSTVTFSGSFDPSFDKRGNAISVHASGLAVGTWSVKATFTDVLGSKKSTTKQITILDTTPPSVTAPRHGLTNSPIVDSKPSVRLVWSGSDDGSGIARYEVQVSTNGGAWKPFAALNYYAISPRLPAEQTYRFRVRAIDKAGNPSPWATGETFRLTRISEGNARVTYSGTWTMQSSPSYWLGAARRSGQAGARATLSFTGKSVAWVATQGPNRGKAEIWVDGARATTIDLASTSALYRQVVWTKSWLIKGAHTVQIRVLGTAGRPYVDVDAFVVLE